MKTHLFTILIILCLLVSCREETDPKRACSVDNPVEDLAWLASQIQEWESTNWREYAFVTQAKYENETVFIFGNCCPMCNTVIPVYNCSGERIGIINYDIDEHILKNEVLIWKSEFSTCTISY